MVYVLGFIVLGLLVAYGFAGRKIQMLDAKNADLKNQVNALSAPKTFGLTALEAVGGVLNELSESVVKAAYAAASVCGMKITVPDDVATEKSNLAVAIGQSRMEIENLEGRIKETQAKLRLQGDRSSELAKIAAMLPK
jgi:hypothetical protein